MADRTRNWDKTPAARQYRDRYTAEHYDIVKLILPRGYKQLLADAARESGLSQSRLIVRLLDTYLSGGATDGDDPHI